MPSTSESLGMREWMTTQRNLTILTAIFVGVPTAYDEYWSKYDRARTAVAWTVTACVVATVEFTSFYLLGVELLGLSTLFASVGAFLVTELGNLSWLAVRNRRGTPPMSHESPAPDRIVCSGVTGGQLLRRVEAARGTGLRVHHTML